MKNNLNFISARWAWLAGILPVLLGLIIWANVDGLKSTPSQKLPDTSAVAPPVPAPLPIPRFEPQAEPVEAGHANTAIAVQEGLNHAIAMIRPMVVTISTKSAPVTTHSANGLAFIEPFAGNIDPTGSGVIIDRRGYVLTNFQTIGTAKAVQVTVFSANRQQYQADVVKIDHTTDLALLKIRSERNFPAAIIGNSDTVEIGDIVLSVGSPYGFSRSVAMGIVSTNRRKIAINDVWYPDLIQTDAVINSGDDGGPLVNIRGEIIGINMAYFIPNNHFTGIGFALPINDADLLLQGIIQ